MGAMLVWEVYGGCYAEMGGLFYSSLLSYKECTTIGIRNSSLAFILVVGMWIPKLADWHQNN